MRRLRCYGGHRMTPWATLIGAHLAASRRAGLGFDQAWHAANAAHPPLTTTVEGWEPATVTFAKRAFMRGYLRQESGIVGALAERERLFTDPARDRPAVERRCGWGDGCDREAREGGWLCPEHSKRVRGIFALCLHPECHTTTNGKGPGYAADGHDFCPKHGGPSLPRTQALRRTKTAVVSGTECVTPGCKRTAHGLRCKRHEKVAA
jgi:hypothetical protein